ncbi:ParB/RepB/Spo0J family partition protein [Synoicihabitans lomoniglobus]|uniref:ParB/RepB/Spo0J family partition protein n=1 Tax=Synoicihabitans lomoniglobus TaxID=2909285 RepID=A0AAF0I4K2_9BACT|nr:ParB/RepB/Spo0J family partition protein [Opitutaceae bacterium LMO-M01]WED66883.1 ParB/RepB/Spo0J family partition protein [Opitutaceae bacterium LMO-M01]
MAASKSRLGRGLGGLIAGAASKSPTAQAAAKTVGPLKSGSGKASDNQASPAPAAGFEDITVTQIEPSPYQARREIKPEHLSELAESIKAEGLLQPIVVRKLKAGKYELIAGERRWRAYQVLKLKTIPARVVEASNASSAALGLIENLQREGLNAIEEAYGYASLIRDFDLTQEQASDRVGKSRASVANTLRLLNLDAELQGYVAKSILSVGHAKVLLGVEAPAERAIMARRVIEDGLSVRGTEKLVQDKKAGGSGGKKSAQKGGTPAEAAAINGIEKKLTSHLGARVALKHSGKRGQIVIRYAGNDDLQRILERLGLEA